MDIIILVFNLGVKQPFAVMENFILFWKINFDKIKVFDQLLTFNIDIFNL